MLANALGVSRKGGRRNAARARPRSSAPGSLGAARPVPRPKRARRAPRWTRAVTA